MTSHDATLLDRAEEKNCVGLGGTHTACSVPVSRILTFFLLGAVIEKRKRVCRCGSDGVAVGYCGVGVRECFYGMILYHWIKKKGG